MDSFKVALLIFELGQQNHSNSTASCEPGGGFSTWTTACQFRQKVLNGTDEEKSRRKDGQLVFPLWQQTEAPHAIVDVKVSKSHNFGKKS